ncbi:site-specific integrase [Halopseudomonas laoshanensis]|uniref:Site-specific integrase n=1 Tax=Halopseudomonas laoshanensis TaxID=2268758 RepID=A0A7V7GVJ2_9GAMM|nr:tyrosine-type recombinase/integrase [Halopseudomonas laoshanensis]KAA0696111.1 site-specific integrase [Halopseudomonas laoshanensis]
MNEQTKKRYSSLARHFYKHHMNHAPLSLGSIAKELIKSAAKFRPDYFRILKNALSFDLQSRGYSEAAIKIKAIVNPVTVKGSTLTKKPKLARARSCSNVDLLQLANHLFNAGYYEEFAAISLISYTGARPAELHAMQIDDNVLFIEGAKKTEDNVRGADRVLKISNSSAQMVITDCIRILKTSERSIDAIRHRLRIEAGKVWPRRKVLPSMYSIRHQVGADLKASNLAPKVVAYIMGHQSTNSIMRYGDRRQGVAGRLEVEPAQESDLSNVRDKIKSKSGELVVNMLLKDS